MLRAEYVQRRSTVHVREVQEISGVQDPGGPGDPGSIRGVRAHWGRGVQKNRGLEGGLAVTGWRWCAGAGCGWQALMLLWRWHSSGSLMLWLAGYAWLWQAVAGWCDGAQWRCADGWHPSLLRSNRGYRRGHRYISRTTSTARRTVT